MLLQLNKKKAVHNKTEEESILFTLERLAGGVTSWSAFRVCCPELVHQIGNNDILTRAQCLSNHTNESALSCQTIAMGHMNGVEIALSGTNKTNNDCSVGKLLFGSAVLMIVSSLFYICSSP